jgi:hypothetical protein
MDAVENTGGRETPDKQGRGQLAHQDMDKKKNKRTKKASRRGAIYVSPDGGHTVYEQNQDGSRGRLVEEDSHARMLNELQQDSDMFGFEAYALRRKYPTLQKAYDQYKTVWHMINGGEE